LSVADAVKSRTQEAVNEIYKSLDSNPNFERLNSDSIDARGKGYLAGWITVHEPKGIGSKLELYLPAFFPDSPPTVYLSTHPEEWFCRTPHVERDGKICVLAESAAIDADCPVELLKECLERAIEILTNSFEDEFRDEALIYWGLHGGNKHEAFCCTPPTNLGEACIVGVAGKSLILADSEDSAKAWFKNWRGNRAELDFISPCVVVEVDDVLVPKDYPDSYADVRRIIEKHSPEALSQFDKLSCRGTSLFGVVLLQKTKDGPILAGVVAYGCALDSRKDFIKGFRPGMAPTNLLRARARKFFEKKTAQKIRVSRTDSQWIHSRGGTGLNLSEKIVTLIGCGSLGGYVGHLLARAGVGKIRLLDNDILGWENVGRHLLGANQVYRSKSVSLAERLKRELPHLNIGSFFGDWRKWILEPEGSDFFESSDLIISTVADWRCERPLNLAIRKIGTQSSIFAWLEPYGFAAQVLVCGPEGGCFDCGMDRLGKFRERVLDFTDGTLKKEPGGCAYYQQYGPTKILPLASLIVDSAVQRLTKEDRSSKRLTILEDLTSPVQYGGIVRDAYSTFIGSSHSQVIESSWPVHPECSCCNNEQDG